MHLEHSGKQFYSVQAPSFTNQEGAGLIDFWGLYAALAAGLEIPTVTVAAYTPLHMVGERGEAMVIGPVTHPLTRRASIASDPEDC